MPMTTPSGDITYKYDIVVPDDVKKAMDKTLTNVDVFQACVKKRFEDLESDVKEMDEAAAIYRKVNDHTIVVYGTRISEVEHLMYAFLKSKFVRFLNFFGCWFIYSKEYNGLPFINCPSNEIYGKAPFLTRVSRWFRNHFMN